MSAKPPFEYTVSSNGGTVELSFGETSVTLTTEQLQIVIWWLGQVRSEMTPSVAATPAQDAPVLPISGWRVEPMPGGPPVQVGGRIMFRSPHFGWFAIPISPEGFRLLVAGAIGAQIAKPPDAKLN